MESANVSARASNRILAALHYATTGVINDKDFLKVTFRAFKKSNVLFTLILFQSYPYTVSIKNYSAEIKSSKHNL